MKKFISKIIFWIIGWKVVGKLIYPDKCLVIGAPHTSNWDFLIGRCYGYIIGITPKYLMKSELFLPIIGYLFRRNGAIPVNRNTKNNFVDHIVEIYNKSDKFILGISPEGTRKRVDRWKTGFYHIAVNAKIPILLLKLDYQKKEIGIINQCMLTGDFEKDMLFIENEYKDSYGKIPQNYNPNIF